MVTIPTQPIGGIPRPLTLIEAIAPDPADSALEPLYDEAIRDTITQFEATGSPVTTDGEQRKYHNFWTQTAFARIRARVEGTAMASARIRAH
jgi:5-methyltetrahydropteroyltriglutamate--homocysteine methyltransferase